MQLYAVIRNMIPARMQCSPSKDLPRPAKVLDVISRLPGCAGQPSDAVSAYTQVPMEDAPKLLGLSESECPTIRQDPVVLLERNLYGHPFAGLLWERQFEKVLIEKRWETVPSWECLFMHREMGLFLSVNVDDVKMGGQKYNLKPVWDKLMKQVDIGEPTSL